MVLSGIQDEKVKLDSRVRGNDGKDGEEYFHDAFVFLINIFSVSLWLNLIK
jgi:hypothetical protein